MRGSITIVTGHYGSGKSRFAGAHAWNMRTGVRMAEKVVLIDPLPEGFPVAALERLRDLGYEVVIVVPYAKSVPGRAHWMSGSSVLVGFADRIYEMRAGVAVLMIDRLPS